MLISNFKTFVARWLFSANPKGIGTLYFIFGIFSGIICTVLSIIIHSKFEIPGNLFLLGNHQLYNVLVTVHSFVTTFFMVIPVLLRVFGNWLMPVIPESIALVFSLWESVNSGFSILSALLFLTSNFFETFVECIVYPSVQGIGSIFQRLPQLYLPTYGHIGFGLDVGEQYVLGSMLLVLIHNPLHPLREVRALSENEMSAISLSVYSASGCSEPFVIFFDFQIPITQVDPIKL